MTGVKSGVATLLKKENPQVISVHCICHRLALACTDTLQNIGYIKSVHTWLMQLWNMLQKSPKKMASFLQIHLRIKNLQLTTQESKPGVSKRLKKACTTRWLSFDSSVQAIDSEYEAVERIERKRPNILWFVHVPKAEVCKIYWHHLYAC